MYFLNEKIRNVLSLAFQRFHTIFDELQHLQTNFQTELDREFSTLIDRLTAEMKVEAEKKSKQIQFDENELLTKIRASFQEMVRRVSLKRNETKSSRVLVDRLRSVDSTVVARFILVSQSKFYANGSSRIRFSFVFEHFSFSCRINSK